MVKSYCEFLDFPMQLCPSDSDESKIYFRMDESYGPTVLQCQKMFDLALIKLNSMRGYQDYFSMEDLEQRLLTNLVHEGRNKEFSFVRYVTV